MVKKIIAVPIWHMQEFIYLIRSTTTHYLMLQPSHVYSPLQNRALESKNRAMQCLPMEFSFLSKNPKDPWLGQLQSCRTLYVNLN